MTIQVTWRDLELDGTGAYNESFIASLRKLLKAEELRGGTVSLELRLDAETAPPWLQDRIAGFPGDDGLQDRYVGAAAHCRRRLKHCKILGWTVSSSWAGPGIDAFIHRLMERLTVPASGTTAP
ncbi:MAG: hypothetical protein LBP60_06525 [Spirochaetaceae bacterium]|jgi:hypothetical protein|nr:hypothetical protein [Spirochaetaceae bacterium]